MALLVLAYLLVTLAVQAARFIKRFYVRRFANNINRRMKGILYANLVRESRTSLEKEGAGELMTKAISDVDDCVEGMRKFTTEVFDTGVVMVSYGVMLLVYDWRLALLSLLFTPISYFCAAKMKKACSARRSGVQESGECAQRRNARPRAERRDLPYLRLRGRPRGTLRKRAEELRKGCCAFQRVAIRPATAVSGGIGAGVLFVLWFGAKNVLGTGWSAWDIGAFHHLPVLLSRS